MLARAIFAVLAVGLVAAAVLSLRQARLQTAHELTQARLRAALLDEQLDEKRAQIAEMTSPLMLAEPGMTGVAETEEDAGVIGLAAAVAP